MRTARALSDLYEANASTTSKYVHACSRGHEAIQIAVGMQLMPQDWISPYYRDDSILLSIGMQPYELMLQLLAKKDDPFSGGRTYYSHPSLIGTICQKSLINLRLQACKPYLPLG